MKRVLILILFILGSTAHLVAQDSLLIDVIDKWFSYDNKMSPKSITNLSDETTIHLITEKFSGGNVKIIAPKGTSILLNNQLVKVTNAENAFYFYLEKNDGSISLYNPNGFAGLVTEINFPVQNHPLENKISSRLQNHDFNNFLITALLIILILYAFNRIKSADLFSNHFKLTRALTFRTISESIFKIRILEKSNLLLFFAHSLSMSLVIIILVQWTNITNRNLSWLLASSFMNSVWKWLLLAIITWILLLFKSAAIAIISRVFQINNFSRIHFYTHLRLTIFIYSFWLFISVLFIYQFPEFQIATLVIKIGLFLMIIRQLLIFVKLLNSQTHRFLYLFSYICATELIPYIIMAKVMYS